MSAAAQPRYRRRDGSPHESAGALRRVAEQARALGLREAVVLMVKAFERNELLTYASAISFQLLFALIPLALFALGLLGGSGLEGVWNSQLAPQIRAATSPAAFQIIDDTVRQVLSRREVFWITAGAALAVWEMSGAVRAAMGALNRIYGARDRSWLGRMAISIALGAAVIVLLISAAATLEILPRVVDGGVAGPAVAILRWPLALLLLWATVTLVVGVAPAEARPPGRMTFGATLVVLAWLAASAAFGWYLTNVAHYGSIFGALATVVVILTYLYISSIAFLTGAQLDALIHQRLSGAGARTRNDS